MTKRLINSFSVLLSVFRFEIGIKFCLKKGLDNRYCKKDFSNEQLFSERDSPLNR